MSLPPRDWAVFLQRTLHWAQSSICDADLKPFSADSGVIKWAELAVARSHWLVSSDLSRQGGMQVLGQKRLLSLVEAELAV